MENNLNKIKLWLGKGSINIFGLPFSGKDTQGRKLATDLQGELISSGEILRHSQENSEIQEVMKTGGNISSAMFESIVLPFLKRAELADKPLVLSEVGRLINEAPIVMKAAQDSGHTLKAVILLNLSDEVVWQRFDEAMKIGDRGQRADDNREALKIRLEKYHSNIEPVINFYRDNKLLVEVDGSASRDAVTKQIIDELVKLATT